MTIDVRDLALQDQKETEERAGGEHGEITIILSGYLFNHVYPNKLGRLFDGQTDFEMPGLNKTHRPDIAFVVQGRLPNRVRGSIKLAPDLAVEVASPTDYAYSIEEKVAEYLRGGVRLMWVVYPVSQKVAVYRPVSGLKEQAYTGEDELSGEDVLAGFKLKVNALFE